MSSPCCLHLNRDNGKTSILFLHHLFASHVEYDNVIPFLKDYNLMLIDLPRPTTSSETPPFELATIANDLAELIREQSKNGRAHLVGLSMGGFIALELAKRHPELVDSVFVTGAVPLEGFRRSLAQQSFMLYLEYGLVSFLKLCPDWFYSRICSLIGAESHEELRAETTKNFCLDLLRQGYTAMLNFTAQDMAAIRVRTLLVAASALDNVEATKRMGKVLQENNPESRAAAVKGYVHSWNLRFPELFANTITAWANNTYLPDGVDMLV